jgi:positive regulator of sigma E activity
MTHTLSVPCDQPLVAGQKVELGIGEASLLTSALLVYMSPLVGLFLMSALFQMLLIRIWPHVRRHIGWGWRFFTGASFSPKLANRSEWQPVIISVGLPPTWCASTIHLPNNASDFPVLPGECAAWFVASMSISPHCGCSVECGVSDF